MALGIRQRQREATRAEIVAAAWSLAQTEGVAALTLRQIAAAVGMQAPSLYTHFPSKMAIYDALFAEGYKKFLDLLPILDPPPSDPAAAVRKFCHDYMAFCQADPARYALLFQRPVPNFEPGPESMKLVMTGVDFSKRAGSVLGLTHPGAMDLFSALVSGLASQQIANDLGGDRWVRLVDDAVDMFMAHVAV